MRALSWTLGLSLALSVGCGSYGDVCEAMMKCRRGNDKDVTACAIELDRLEQRSDLAGCGGEWEAFASCLEEQGRCESGYYSAPCDEVRTTWKVCADLDLEL